MPHPRTFKAAPFLFFVVLAWAFGTETCQSSARADDESELLMAQALSAEAGFRAGDDHYAIIHVLRYRASLSRFSRERGIVGMARAYCAIFRMRVKNRRQQEILAMKLEDFPREIRVLARKAVNGEDVPNPCQNLAIHWGSRTDNSPLPVVNCGHTGNIFRGPPR